MLKHKRNATHLKRYNSCIPTYRHATDENFIRIFVFSFNTTNKSELYCKVEIMNT